VSAATGLPELIDRGACPLCAGAAFTLVHDFDRIPVRRCDTCGFVHSARVMTGAEAARYYAQDFGSPWHKQGQRINADVNMLALSRLVDLRTLVDASRSRPAFLDVGTGYGFLMDALRKRGVRADGVEVSGGESAFARETLGLSVRTAMLHEAGLTPASYDVAACFEVIEHIADPTPFVAEMARHVRPGGYVIIGTDNFEASIVRRMGASFPKWIPHSHVSHFGPATLRACVQRVPGLRVVDAPGCAPGTGGVSFTTWEMAARDALRRLRGRPTTHDPADARAWFDLERTLKVEMRPASALYWPRRVLTPWWFRLAWRRDLEGAMMYVLARKEA
jgi:SAM-dependent methyltransferase